MGVARRVAVGVAAIAMAGTGFALASHLPDHGSATSATPAPAPSATAKVVRTDLSRTTQVNGLLEYTDAGTVVAPIDAVAFTALPIPGTVIDRGQTVYEVDGRAVPLFLGARPAWRSLHVGAADGPDVQQVEDNLVALGFADPEVVHVDNHFDAASAAAVRAWQRSTGRTVTGRFDVGAVVWATGAIRIGTVDVVLGAPARAGTVVAHTTSTRRVVVLQIDVSAQRLVQPGIAVAVGLPDGTEAPGSVTSVSPVALSATVDQNQSGRRAPPTVDVTIDVGALETPYDEAPVTVDLIESTVTGVLAVPINALVAPADGGFAVEVVGASGTHFVAVHTGLFARTMVEVTGTGIEEGTTVSVPAP
jgi:peptidoglycan hydrolase-like protein with peptidoglycan-binding domain